MVEAGGSSWHQSNRGVSIYFGIYLALFYVVIVFSKFLHDRPKLASFIPEAAMVILVGMVVGLLFHVFIDKESIVMGNSNEETDDAIADDVAKSLLSFSPTVFFVILLPPIIFNSGYHLQRELFFRHIVPICLYACVGTAFATFIFASFLRFSESFIPSFNPSFLELLTFGALISATDPVSTLAVFQAKKVDPHLFYLVFGESVINDAVGLVLFEALAHLLEMYHEKEPDVNAEVKQFLFDFITGFIGSMLLGLCAGLGTAWFFKTVDLRRTPTLELCLYVPIMYTPFVIAEIARLSGIVTLLFAGITARRYIEPNLSSNTAENAGTIFRLVAHITETIIFLELGLSVFDLSAHGNFHMGFIVVSMFGCFLSRACNIYPLTFLYNTMCGDQKEAGQSAELKRALDVEIDESSTPTCAEIKQETQETKEIMDVEKKQISTDKIVNDRSIPLKTAHMLWFSGLRGAVSYALVRTFPDTGNQTYFIVTTMVIVLITTFVLGGTTEIALKCLDIPMGVDETSYMKSLDRRYFLQGPLRRFEAYTLRRWAIRDFNKRDKCDDNDTDDEIVYDENVDDGMAYHEHVDGTEEDNTKIAEVAIIEPKHEMTEPQEEETECKTSSLYNFGFFSVLVNY